MALVKARSDNRLWEKIGLIIASGFLYATTIASVEVATRSIPPFTLTALRLVIASLVFGVIFLFLKPQVKWTRRTLIEIFFIGLLNVGIPFLSLALAVKYISSSLASVIFNIQPVFTVLIAHVVLADEKLNLPKIIGMLSAIVGATLLMALRETGLGAGNNQGWIGQFIIIFASLAGAVGVVAARSLLRDIDPPVLAAGQVIASLIVIGPLALATEGLPAFDSYAWQGWIAMFLAAVCAPVIAYWLLFYMVNKYSASLAGFSSIATPLFSVLIGVLLLGEIITLPITFGALLLLAGVWFLHYF